MKRKEQDKFQHEIDQEEVRRLLVIEKGKYQKLFASSQLGMYVLGSIVKNYCHFGDELDPNAPIQVAEYNVGIRLLTMVGAFDDKRWTDVFGTLIKPLPLPLEEE